MGRAGGAGFVMLVGGGGCCQNRGRASGGGGGRTGGERTRGGGAKGVLSVSKDAEYVRLNLAGARTNWTHKYTQNM